MKKFILFVCIAQLNLATVKAVTEHKVLHQKDSLTWIEDFKLFRTAVYNNDMATVKKYFKFPVLNVNNEIWLMLMSDKAFKKIQAAGDKIVPFKETDLDKYYKNLFTGPFVKSLMKVKTDILYKKHDTETPEQKEGKATTYKMYVTYDKATKILSFNLAYNTVNKNKAGEIEDGGESNVIYNFIVQKNGHILFKEVRLAG